MFPPPVQSPAAGGPSRWSSAREEYFCTLRTDRRSPGLVTASFTSEFHAATHLLSLERRWHLRTATILPNQLDLFATLSEHTNLPAVLALLQIRLTPCLQRSGLRWERSSFHHRLTPEEDLLPVFAYIYQHPYRTRLLRAPEPWPGYYCAEADWSWFAPLHRTPCPLPDWLP